MPHRDPNSPVVWAFTAFTVALFWAGFLYLLWKVANR